MKLILSNEEYSYSVKAIEDILNKILRGEYLPQAPEGARFAKVKYDFERTVWNKYPNLKGSLFLEGFINETERYIIARKSLPPKGY